MTETLDLARRAVACKHWRWMPGMLANSTDGGDPCGRIVLIRGAFLTVPDCDSEALELMTTDRALPDFTDPATLGCLLALVYEAHKGGIIPASRVAQWFRDPAALVAALEAAP